MNAGKETKTNITDRYRNPISTNAYLKANTIVHFNILLTRECRLMVEHLLSMCEGLKVNAGIQNKPMKHCLLDSNG